ncbi:MAG: hypothetical protein KGZ25_13800, partial [Planctomycetes bacterium]|nr:hypothetical protein [Planctomycetota bacterium]
MCYLADDMDWDEDISAGILINGEITYGLIDEDLAREIAAVHAEVLVDCYIDQTVLSKAAELGGKNIGTYLKEHILPDEPRIISGDSGEVLARSVLQEWGDQPSIPNYRWRNKEHKN